MGDALGYRFDDLGWLQFDRLCSALLDLECIAWEEREFGRVGLAPEGVVPPGGGPGLVAPTLVVVAWLRPAGSASRQHSHLGRILATELERAPVRAVGSILVLTNVDAPSDGAPVPSSSSGPSGSVSFSRRTRPCACASRRCSGSETSKA